MTHKIEKLFRAPYAVPNGLQVTAEGLWIVDQITDRVALVEIGDRIQSYGVSKFIRDIPSESSNTSGLGWDGEALWLAANGDAHLWRPARAHDASAPRLQRHLHAFGHDVGRRVRVSGSGDTDEWLTVIGVIEDIKHDEIDPEDGPNPAIYIPYAYQQTLNTGFTLRVAGPPAGVMPEVRAQVRAADANLPIFGVRTMEELRRLNFWQFAIFGWVFSIIGGIALAVLSGVSVDEFARQVYPALAKQSATLAAAREGWPEEVLLGTASLGGTYQVYGDGLVTRISEELGIAAVSQVTGGPYHNMTLVHTGEAELGLVTLGPAQDLWDGEADFARGEAMRDVRALFPMYQTPFHVVALADSGIESIEDLSGKRIGVGPMGGTCASYWPRFLETLGIEDMHLQYAGANHLADYLTSRLSDAFAFCAGLPIGAFERLERNRDVRMFGLTEEQQATLLEAFPVSAFEIPADTYASMDAPQASVAFWNFAIGHKDLPESFVYELMKLVLDHPEAMEAIHPAAAETRAEHLDKNGVIWIHPGAVRYYEEQGLEVPTAMLPPEMRPDEEAEEAADVADDDAGDETPSNTAD